MAHINMIDPNKNSSDTANLSVLSIIRLLLQLCLVRY